MAHKLATRAERLELVGLTRGRRAVGGWDRLVSCDLFSLKDVERALQGARFALYLVHSMLPSARLVQGRFSDLDLICADNFGRAAAKAGVEQIVYLGGLIPELPPEGAHGVPVTTLRAGMVIHDFVPRLPWWLYRISQAIVHRWVMARFGRHLAASPPVQPSLPAERDSAVAALR